MRARSAAPGSSGGAGASGSSARNSMGVPMIGRRTASTSAASVTSVTPCLNQIVASLRAGIERRARYGEHLAALLEREAGGDERARAPGRLHHPDAGANAGNEPMATGKVPRAGLMPEGHFRNERALRQNRAGEFGVFGRIEAVMAAGKDGDGAGRQTRASPETTAKPASPSSRASCSAKRTPAADALRAPTTATAGRLSAAALPRTAKSGGASSIICRRRG